MNEAHKLIRKTCQWCSGYIARRWYTSAGAYLRRKYCSTGCYQEWRVWHLLYASRKEMLAKHA